MFSQSHFHVNAHSFILKVTNILLFGKKNRDKSCSGKTTCVKEGSIVKIIYGFESKNVGSTCLRVTFQRELVYCIRLQITCTSLNFTKKCETTLTTYLGDFNDGLENLKKDSSHSDLYDFFSLTNLVIGVTFVKSQQILISTDFYMT